MPTRSLSCGSQARRTGLPSLTCGIGSSRSRPSGRARRNQRLTLSPRPACRPALSLLWDASTRSSRSRCRSGAALVRRTRSSPCARSDPNRVRPGAASPDDPGVPPAVARGFGPEWTRYPIARLRYTKTSKTWSLLWRDRNLRFHEYDRVAPSARVDDLYQRSTMIRPPSSGGRPSASPARPRCEFVERGDASRDCHILLRLKRVNSVSAPASTRSLMGLSAFASRDPHLVVYYGNHPVDGIVAEHWLPCDSLTGINPLPG